MFQANADPTAPINTPLPRIEYTFLLIVFTRVMPVDNVGTDPHRTVNV